MGSRFALIIAAAAVSGALASPSEAATRHHRHFSRSYAAAAYAEPSLRIERRSFLDAGVVVPVGSEEAYVAESTTIGSEYVVRDMLHNRIDAWKAGKFAIPGDPEPLVTFETPGAPY